MNIARIIRINWLAAGLLVAPLGAMAFGPGPQGGPQQVRMPPPPLAMAGMPPPPPGLHLHELTLTEAQQDKLFALVHERAPRQRELSRAAFKAMEELRRLARGDGFEPARAKGLADAHGKALAELALIQAELEAKTRQLLTPEQKAQLTRHEDDRDDCDDRDDRDDRDAGKARRPGHSAPPERR